MANPKLWSELQATFIADLKTTRQLQGALKKERTTLEAREYDQLEAIIALKAQLLEKLQQQILVRQKLFQSAGFQQESEALAAVKVEAPSVAKAWQQIAEQWQSCQELSVINERIVQRTKQVVGQTLDLLRGQQGQQKLYSPSGETQSGQLGRSITSA